jgi:hypothetical protein
MGWRQFLLGKEHVRVCSQSTSLDSLGTPPKQADGWAQALVEGALTQSSADPVVLNKQTVHDLELFRTFDHCTQQSVAAALDRTVTRCGGHVLRQILRRPLHDRARLERRRDALRCLSGLQICQLDELLETLRKHEADALWLLQEDHEELGSLLNLVHFTTWMTRPLNNMSSVVDLYNLWRKRISPMLCASGPLLYALLPFLILRMWLGIRIPMASYLRMLWHSSWMLHGAGTHGMCLTVGSMALSVIMYFQGVLTSLDLATLVSRVTSYVTRRVDSAVAYACAAQKLQRQVDPALRDLYRDLPLDIDTDALIRFRKTLWPSSLRLSRSPSAALAFVNDDSPANLFDRRALRAGLLATSVVDWALGVAKLGLSADNRVCWATFDAPHGHMELQGLLHPCIDPASGVRNDLFTKGQSIVVTGPNAGGKSTLVKALGLAVLCAQSLTLVSATSARISPVSFLATHINVPDRTGAASLFQAQLGHICDILKDTERQTSSLVIADELFNSTNPAEGEVAAWAMARALFRRKSCVVVVTTHFKRVAESLSKEGEVQALCVEDFRVTPGVSDQVSGLRLLRQRVQKHLPETDHAALGSDLDNWVLL